MPVTAGTMEVNGIVIPGPSPPTSRRLSTVHSMSVEPSGPSDASVTTGWTCDLNPPVASDAASSGIRIDSRGDNIPVPSSPSIAPRGSFKVGQSPSSLRRGKLGGGR